MSIPDNMTLQGTVGQSDSRGGSKNRNKSTSSLSDLFSWPARIVLLLIVVLSPWAMGSVNFWSQRWITVGILFCLGFWWFETALNSKKKQVFPYLFFPLVIGLFIGWFQTIGLPDWLAGIVLGRQQELYELYSAQADPKLSISLDRDQTWQQINLLVMAIGGLLLGCRYFRTKRDLAVLMTVGTLNGVAIALFSIWHKMTADYATIFWVIPLEIRTEVYGPFVNPNNCAGYLLLCLACAIGLLPIVMSEKKNSGENSVTSNGMPIWHRMYYNALEFISELTAKKMAVLIAIVIISFGVLGSLSRGGVVALLAGGMGTLLLYGMARKPKNSGLLFLALGGMVLALSTWIGVGDKIVKQFEQIDVADVSKADIRLQLWKDMLPSTREMGIFGSGLGSHKSVHRLYRTHKEDALYVYAENQYIQALIEAGWPGLILFLIAWFILYKLISLMLNDGKSPSTIGAAALGLFLFFSQAVASIFDFGFYIGANLLFLSVLVGFVSYQGQALAGRLKRKSWLQFQIPNYSIQVVVLVLFAVSTMVALDLHRKARIDTLISPKAKFFDQYTMSVEETEQRIAELAPLVKQNPTTKGLNYVGELWIHRCRMMLFDETVALVELAEIPELGELTAEQKEAKAKKKKAMQEQQWNLTHLQRIHENLFFYRREVSKYEAARFMKKPAIRSNLENAAAYFGFSRNKSPLQPVCNLRVGMIKGILRKPRDGDEDIERCLALAPYNGSFRELAANYYLQSDFMAAATVHLKRVLELNPNRFKILLDGLMGRSSINAVRVPDDVICDQVIPDNPRMLYDFATDYLAESSPVRGKALERAEELLQNQEYARRENMILLGKICDAAGKLDQAIEYYRKALVSQPNDPYTRYELARALGNDGRLTEAVKETEKLRRENPEKGIYGKYLKELETRIRNENAAGG